jgi:hypothetical protein
MTHIVLIVYFIDAINLMFFTYGLSHLFIGHSAMFVFITIIEKYA